MGAKITVIGGASSYTPELFANLVEFFQTLPIDQVTLMDLNEDKLTSIALVGQKLLEEAQRPIKIKTTTQYETAITDADFIILQIRVGGLAARIRDETLPMEFNMVGNETTGAGGFVCALRTVPAAMKIAKEVERLAPDAWLLNLSNPAGIVTEAILKKTKLKTLGFCNIPINTTYALAEVLDLDPKKIQLDSFGLNHLSWSRSVYFNDQELLQPLLAKVTDRESILYQRGLVESFYSLDWLKTLKMIPGWYLRYFYFPDQIIEKDRQAPQVRGEQDIQAEKKLAEIYSNVGYGIEAQQILKGKGGAQYYLPVLQVIDSILNDRGDRIIVDTVNQSAMPDLPENVCIEIPAKIYRDFVEPLDVGPMPLSVRGLVQAVKAYEELTVEAALNGDVGAALAALMINPLVGSYSKAKAFFDRVLENEADYIAKAFYQG